MTDAEGVEFFSGLGLRIENPAGELRLISVVLSRVCGGSALDWMKVSLVDLGGWIETAEEKLRREKKWQQKSMK